MAGLVGLGKVLSGSPECIILSIHFGNLSLDALKDRDIDRIGQNQLRDLTVHPG